MTRPRSTSTARGPCASGCGATTTGKRCSPSTRWARSSSAAAATPRRRACSRRCSTTPPRPGPDHPPIVHVVHNLGLAHLYLAEYDQADRLFERAVELLRAQPDRSESLVMLNNMAVLNLMRGRFQAAEGPLKELERTGRETLG